MGPSSTRAAAPFLLILLLNPLGVSAQTAGEGTPGDQEDDDAEEDAESMMIDDSGLDDQAARELFNAGRSLYDIGRYHEAAQQFQQAYDLSQRPGLLYNLYLSHRDASEIREAAAALRLYLEQMPDLENRQALTVRLEHLDNAIAQQDAERAAAEAQAEEAARAEQERRDQEEAERRARENEPSIVPWIVAASGGALMLAGVITGAVALSLSSGLETDCTADGDGTFSCPDDPDLRSQQSTLSVLAPLTDVFLIGGALIAAAGVTWGILQMSSGDDEDAPSVAAACGPTGCGATMRMGF